MKKSLITLSRVFQTGVINFFRNIPLAMAAIAVMVVTLTIVLFSLIANATFSNTIKQITSQIDISVYLKDSTTTAQANSLAAQLRKQPAVAKVNYLNKAQALAAYANQNKSNPSLITAAEEAGNPIPATIQIYPTDLNKVGQIISFLKAPGFSGLQTADSPSYNGDRKVAIDNITHATDVLRKVGIIAVVVFAVICALIIFNTMQMAIFNRRDEITIMRLLGASTNYIRGPFIVESAIYGCLAAIFSILIVNSAFLAASGALQASSLGLLDINYANQYFDNNFWLFLLLQIVIGIMIGAVSAFIATKRYLKFRTTR